MRKGYFSFAIAVATLLLTACGGHTPGLLPAPSTGNVPTGGGPSPKAVAQIRILIPTSASTSNSHLRHLQFISSSTNALQVQIYAANSTHVAGNLIATSVTDLSSGSSSCTPSGGGRTCTFTISAPSPADDFVFATYDLAPVGGAIPGGAKQLAAASLINQPITAGQTNTLNVTLGGVVSSLQLSLPNPQIVSGLQTSSIHGVITSTQNFGVNALDADGNVILSDGFVDANGNPVSVAVNVTPSASTCGSGTLQLGAGTPGGSVALSAPANTGVQFNYGATAVAAVFTPATACTFAIAASVGSATANANFALLGPEFTEVPLATGAVPFGITNGPDGALWFTEFFNNKVGRITTAGSVTATYSSGTEPYGIATGSDGALWFAERGANKIGSVTTAGAVTEPAVASGGPTSIASGSDGALWFTEFTGSKIGRTTTGGAVTEYPTLTPNSSPFGITSGPDGALWFAECGSSKIGRITTGATPTVTEYAVTTGGSHPSGIASGPDGALWFTENSASQIGRIKTDGTVTNEYPTLTSGAGPVGIVSGPDGALWFAECTGNKIGRITTSGAMTEYAIPTASSGPASIAVGPDGALWFTETTGNNIGRLSW